MAPLAHLSPQRFAGLTTVTDQETDHATQSVTIGRIYIHSTVRRPNNYNWWRWLHSSKSAPSLCDIYTTDSYLNFGVGGYQPPSAETITGLAQCAYTTDSEMKKSHIRPNCSKLRESCQLPNAFYHHHNYWYWAVALIFILPTQKW